MFLTDDLENPVKWRIPDLHPDSTIIPAKGFIVLWADKELNDGVLHLDFSLNSTGGEIGLAQFSNGNPRYIDYYKYGEQDKDLSSGRYPDAGLSWVTFPFVTPGAINAIPSSVRNEQLSPEAHLYPNPSTGFFYLSFEPQGINSEVASIKIFNSIGLQIYHQLAQVNSGSGKILQRIDLSAYSKGLYFIQVITGDKTITLKIEIQ